MVRIKNRYIVVQVRQKNPTKELTLKDGVITKCVLQNVEKYFGSYGLGTVERGFRIKYCNKRTKIAIIRCLHKYHHFIKATLPFITMIGDVNAKFNILYVGATIIHCNKFIIKHHHKFLDRTIGSIVSAKERKDMIDSVLQFENENKT